MIKIKNLTLLYIENDGEIREKYTKLLREYGFKVFKTDNETKACDLFQTHEINLILIDIDLPGTSGFDFIHRLRDKEILTPIIITSSHAEKEVLFEAINLDITHYLIKPFKIAELVEALQIAVKKVFNCHTLTFTHLRSGYSYDPVNKTVSAPSGEAIQLSKKEHLIIELLISNKSQIIPYDIIETMVWQGNLMSMDALRTLVRGIRKKTYPDIITNVNGVGYKIDL